MDLLDIIYESNSSDIERFDKIIDLSKESEDFIYLIRIVDYCYEFDVGSIEITKNKLLFMNLYLLQSFLLSKKPLPQQMVQVLNKIKKRDNQLEHLEFRKRFIVVLFGFYQSRNNINFLVADFFDWPQCVELLEKMIYNFEKRNKSEQELQDTNDKKPLNFVSLNLTKYIELYDILNNTETKKTLKTPVFDMIGEVFNQTFKTRHFEFYVDKIPKMELNALLMMFRKPITKNSLNNLINDCKSLRKKY